MAIASRRVVSTSVFRYSTGHKLCLQTIYSRVLKQASLTLSSTWCGIFALTWRNRKYALTCMTHCRDTAP